MMASFPWISLERVLHAPTWTLRRAGSENLHRGDKWSFCLTAGTLCLRIRSDHDETSAPEPHTSLQGEGGPCGRQRRSDIGSAGGAVRRPSEPDHVMES